MAGTTKALTFSEGVAVTTPAFYGPTKYDFTDVAIASNTFAKPSTAVARITSGSGPLYTISGGSNGDVLVIENKSGASITISNEQATSGFTTGTGGDITLDDDASLTLIYNSTDTYWSVIGGSGSGGSGSGEINYIDAWDAETGTTGWSTYDDGASATPVDGTGGSPSTMTLTAQDTTVLRGSKSFKLLKSAADGQGEGISSDFTIKEADKNKLLKIELDYKVEDVSGTAYVSDDFAVYIYDVTNTTLITPSSTGIAEYDSANDGAGKFLVSWSATDSASYRLIIHQTTASTGSYALYFDRVIVGPGSIVTGAAVTEWEAWTPTGTWTTNVTYSGFKKRIGDELEAYVKLSLSGATDAVQLDIDLPSGLTIDTSKTIVSGVNNNYFGHYTILDYATNYYHGKVYADSTNTRVTLISFKADTTYVSGTTAVSSTAPITFANGDEIWINFKVPIAEWAGSGTQYQLNNNLVAANARMAAYGLTVVSGSNGQSIPNVSVTAINSWDNYTVSGGGSFDGEFYTVPADGWYSVNGLIRWANSAGIDNGYLYIEKNSSTILVTTTLSMDSATLQGQQAYYCGEFSAGDTIRLKCYQDTGGALNLRALDNETQFFVTRVADYSATQPVGFGLADASNAGLVWKHQYVKGVSTSLTDAAYTDVASASISNVPAGTYVAHWSASVRYQWTTTPPTWANSTVVLADSSNNALGQSHSAGIPFAYQSGAAGQHFTAISGTTYFTLATEDTVKMRAFIDQTGGNITGRHCTVSNITIRKVE